MHTVVGSGCLLHALASALMHLHARPCRCRLLLRPPPARVDVQEWLNERVHRLGSLHPSGDELMTAVTGSPLQPQVFLSYLRAKYSKLYKLQPAAA